MPVRSSVCTYNPSSSMANSSKYSTVLPASSPIGHYKPLSSFSSSYATGTGSGRGSGPSSGYSSSSSTLAGGPSGAGPRSYGLSGSGRYGLSSSTSAYCPSGSSYSSSSLGSTTKTSGYLSSSSAGSTLSASSSASSPSTSGGFYRPLSSSTHNSFTSASRYNPTLAATTTTTSTGSSISSGGGYNTHRYSSGSSTGSTASSSSLSSAGSSGGYSSPITSSSHRYLASDYKPSSSSAYRRSSGFAPHQSTNDANEDEPLPSGVPRGLVNLGTTCYMNASIQSLYSIESFRNLVLRAAAGSYDKPLTLELANLFKQMKTTSSLERQSSAISPANFKYAFSKYQQKFSGLGQQDAQEFLRYLINGIHEESNKAGRRPRRSTPPEAPKSAQEAWSLYRDIVDDSPLVDLVVGQMCSTIVCCVCQNKSNCWDPFWDLSLPLVRGRHSCKLSDVLQDFIAKETLDSDERPICSKCKRATRSTKQIHLNGRLPPLIILHLKKFTNDGYKMTSPEIRIDRQLNLENGTSYQLQACISHHGHSSSSGHYTSHCKYSSRWFHFNDDRVRDVTSSFDSAKLNDAYVLFYTQSSPTAAGALDQSKL